MSIDTADTVTSVPLLSASDLDRMMLVHGRRLRNFIRKRMRNPEDVEDLVQETFVEALQCLDRFQGHSKPETWLFGIALNLVRGHYKRAKHRPVLEDESMASEALETEMAEDPMEIVARLQEVERVFDALQRLPQTSVDVLTLVFEEWLTYEEAACRLDIPVGTVRSRISRARAMLKADGAPNEETSR